MDLKEAKRIYKTVANNQDKIKSIQTETFIQFAECLFKELEKSKEG